jgi:signal transduction histidine kinase
MADEHQPNTERHEHGRVVYSRLHKEGEVAQEGARDEQASPVGALHLPGGREVEPLLPVLLVSFVLLVGLVAGLGWLSQDELQAVSQNVQTSDRMQTFKISYLLQLRNALSALDTEARTRQEQLSRHDQQGDIIIPFEKKLGNARDEVRKLLPTFDRLPFAQEPQGRAFRQTLDDYLHTTEDPRNYSLDGFTRFRDLTLQLDSFLEQTGHEQEELSRQRINMEQAAAARIARLTFIAAALALLIAALAVWELQRRFRQLRTSLEAARRERRFSTQMLEGMVSAVAALDAQARIRSANRVFFKLFPQATVGASVYDEIADDKGKKLLAAATAARVTQATYHGRWLLSTDSATDEPQALRSFDVWSSPLSFDGEQGQILTLVDVTEAAQAESELRRKTALAAVGQAAAQVAHEIKNPLGSIRLGVAMLRDMTENPEAHNTIELVERGIEHLNKLTIDVTEFSRERELALAPANVNELLNASLELVADKLRAKETPVERHYTEQALVGELDVDQLRQVFVNLIANAADASEPQVPITITTERATLSRADDENGTHAPAPPAARITITDRGHGMDEQTRARLFEPFFTTKKRGTGLGLAIVKKIVEQHGGRITVESAPRQGTSFQIDLPLAQNR